ncbi:mar1 putative transposase, putative [Trichomonas vaginalis G3]|uniref:Mar1 putative transposase, putative n=1 Tax=Trichomonas vaginalis (strain ATCC PRA-98 / G3) TaxID=412133 RepID=A2F5H6_TRIV3|nr:mar1 putative transposase, putative [Trichomonas vaginalis G3]|eukprot:XP_001312778.1 mar1 transposase [Trichomonas vaginalis G3]
MDAPSYSTVTYHVRMYHFMNKKAPIIKIDKKSPDQRNVVRRVTESEVNRKSDTYLVG